MKSKKTHYRCPRCGYEFPKEEAKGLLAVGFNYIAEKDSVMLFRKSKRFSG